MAKDIKNTSLTQTEKFILKDESLKGLFLLCLKLKNFIGSLCRPREVYIYESRYAVHPNDGLNSQNMKVN